MADNLNRGSNMLNNQVKTRKKVTSRTKKAANKRLIALALAFTTGYLANPAINSGIDKGLDLAKSGASAAVTGIVDALERSTEYSSNGVKWDDSAPVYDEFSYQELGLNNPNEINNLLSAENIDNLGKEVIREYNKYIDMIVLNETLSVVKPELDNHQEDRLDGVVASLGAFKDRLQENGVDLDRASKEVRTDEFIDRASEKKDVLMNQKDELLLKLGYVEENKTESLETQQEIEELNNKLDQIDASLDIVMGKELTSGKNK